MQTNQRIKDIREMENLIKELNQASDAYYNQDKELISNFVYDQLYDRLVDLEKRYGIILAGSPTQNVGFPVVSELKRNGTAGRRFLWIKPKTALLLDRGSAKETELCHGNWMDLLS